MLSAGLGGLEPFWVCGWAVLNHLAYDKENPVYRIVETVDSNPFGYKSGRLRNSLAFGLDLNPFGYGDRQPHAHV